MVMNNNGQLAEPLAPYIEQQDSELKIKPQEGGVIREGGPAAEGDASINNNNFSGETFTCEQCNEQFSDMIQFSHHLDFHEVQDNVSRRSNNRNESAVPSLLANR